MAQPRIGLLAVDLGGLDQAAYLRTYRVALGRVTEQTSLALNDKRLYRTLCQVVVDWQMAGFDIPFQTASVVCQVMHSLAQYALWRHLDGRLALPAFQLNVDRQASFLATDEHLFVANLLEVALHVIQLIDHRQRHIGSSGLTLGLHLLCFDELAARVNHACQSLDTGLQRQSVLTCISVGHHIAAIALQQAQRHFLRTAGGVVGQHTCRSGGPLDCTHIQTRQSLLWNLDAAAGQHTFKPVQRQVIDVLGRQQHRQHTWAGHDIFD